MSIFDDLKLSAVEREQQKAIELSDNIENFLISRYNRLFDTIWNNSSATPQEILDGFGVKAAQLFALSDQVRQMITTYVPNRADEVNKQVPYTYVINQDGSVAVGDKIEEPGDIQGV